MNYKTKSVLISRFKKEEGMEFRRAIIKLFNINDPHKTAELPTETIEFENIEKVVIKEPEVDFFLEGNDLILNNLEEVEITQEGNVVFIS